MLGGSTNTNSRLLFFKKPFICLSSRHQEHGSPTLKIKKEIPVEVEMVVVECREMGKLTSVKLLVFV